MGECALRISAVDSSFFREWGSRYRVYAIRVQHTGAERCSWTVRRTLAQLRSLRKELPSSAELPKLPGRTIVRRWASDRSMIIANFLTEAVKKCHKNPSLLAFLEISALSFDAELGPKIKEGYLVKSPGGYAAYFRSVRVYGLLQLLLVVGTLYSVVFLSDLHMFDTWASIGAYIAGAVLICLTWLRHWTVYRVVDSLLLMPCVVSVAGWIPMVVYLFSVILLPEKWWGKRRRWFVLKPTYLAYYDTNTSPEMKGILADPGDIRRARRFVATYLERATTSVEKFATAEAKGRAEPLRANFNATLDVIETAFTEQQQRLDADDQSDLEVQLDVLRKQMEREGL